MSSLIQEIDYGRLARLSEESGVPFENLCRRAEERGASTDVELLEKRGLVSPTSEWLITKAAAAKLGTSYTSFVKSLNGGQLANFGVRSRSRSKKNPDGRRGCGVLWWRRDLDEVVRLRDSIGVSTRVALRIFQAKRLGLL